MTPLAYDPLRAPFEMPVAIFSLHCELREPLEMQRRAGATLSTLLRGALGVALHEAGLAFLHEPHSPSQKRSHATPVVLRVQTLSRAAHSPQALSALHLSLTLLGRAPVAHQAQVLAAVAAMGQTGLTANRIPFALEVEPGFSGSLDQWVSARMVPCARLRVELVSPLDMVLDNVAGRLVGEAAHDLVQWDLVDRELAPLLGKQGCDLLADAARRAAARSAETLQVLTDVRYQKQGLRRSHSNGNHFTLHGHTGTIHLEGDLTLAWPWLCVAELRGAGRKKSFGLGELRLHPNPPELNQPGVQHPVFPAL